MELRFILLLIGAIIIAAVWLFSRQKSPAEPPTQRAVPSLVNDEDFPGDDLPSKTVPGASQHTAPVREQGEQLILALHVMSKNGDNFEGAKVHAALEASGLRHGRYQVFHRLEGAQSVFSVANVMEPGSIDLVKLDAATLPGLTLFMVLPGPRGGVDAYADMLATARRLATALDGEVLDQDRSTLTRQTARHIRERIITYEHQLRLRRPS
ncbi:MAG: cell division protein ZipA [Bacillota bacterium]